MKIGFSKSEIIPDIFPENPEGLKTSWIITAPKIEDSISCLQINGKYIFSNGEHAPHTNLLLSKKYETEYLEIIKIENFLSYLFDTLLYCSYPYNSENRNKYMSGLKQYFELIGNTFNEYVTLDSIFEEKNDFIANSIDEKYLRKFPYEEMSQTECISCYIPDSENLKMAFTAYRQGLISSDPVGSILNYWRVLEAVSNTDTKRKKLLKSFSEFELLPVNVFKPYIPNNKKTFNLMNLYKDILIEYMEEKLSIFTTTDEVMYDLYKNRRCPSAHAKKNVLAISEDLTLVHLYKDSLLLKYLARCAIEKYWKEEIDT